MRAIVLTCDEYRAITDHMIHSYQELWPDNPFSFRIPYQDDRSSGNHKREFIKAPKAIKATVLKLLEDLPDNEWVYWAIDDKYPIALSLPNIQSISDWVERIDDPSISGICFCRCRRLLKPKHLKLRGFKRIAGPANLVFLERKNYHQIWLHQFLRVKVLRHLFSAFPEEIADAKIMDELYKSVSLPEDHRLFVSRENMAVFGESARRGRITRNCYDSMRRKGMDIPQGFDIVEREDVLGEL